MHVTLIGTGNMARGLGSRVLAGGHDLTVVGKDEQRAEAVAADLGGQGRVGTAVDGDPIEGEVVVLAVYYPDARAAVEQYADQLAGKVVVDITNPVNATFDGLVVPPDGSATNELAGLAPDARFVKAFNTTFAGPLTQGEVDGQTLDVLIAGDDDDPRPRSPRWPATAVSTPSTSARKRGRGNSRRRACFTWESRTRSEPASRAP